MDAPLNRATRNPQVAPSGSRRDMADELRVAPGPAVVRGAPVTIRFEGRSVRAFEGESVGAALHAAGERVLMRSIKYHRPRGLFCGVGKCASCLVRVDGTPNVRACVTPVREGMLVETQNAFPSARRDVFGLVDKAYPRVLDVHEQFARAPLIRPLHHAVVRRMAGFGSLPDLRPMGPRRPPVGKLACDVLVVGAGPSGLAAAVAAAEGAAKVVVVDEADRAGGSLLLEGEATRADELVARLHEADGTLLARTVAFGLYRTDGHGDELPAPGLVALLTPERVVEVEPKAVVVASGHHETPPLFGGNDLPGVMGARAALLLLHRHGILAGKRVLAADASPDARRAADDLAKAGAELVGIVGEGEWRGAKLTHAHGGRVVQRAVLERDGETRVVDVDCIVAGANPTPRVELLQQAGARLVPSGWSLVPALAGPATTAPGVFACGRVAGEADLATRLRQGEAAGEAAARFAREAR